MTTEKSGYSSLEQVREAFSDLQRQQRKPANYRSQLEMMMEYLDGQKSKQAEELWSEIRDAYDKKPAGQTNAGAESLNQIALAMQAQQRQIEELTRLVQALRGGGASQTASALEPATAQPVARGQDITPVAAIVNPLGDDDGADNVAQVLPPEGNNINAAPIQAVRPADTILTPAALQATAQLEPAVALAAPAVQVDATTQTPVTPGLSPTAATPPEQPTAYIEGKKRGLRGNFLRKYRREIARTLRPVLSLVIKNSDHALDSKWGGGVAEKTDTYAEVSRILKQQFGGNFSELRMRNLIDSFFDGKELNQEKLNSLDIDDRLALMSIAKFLQDIHVVAALKPAFKIDTNAVIGNVGDADVKVNPAQKNEYELKAGVLKTAYENPTLNELFVKYFKNEKRRAFFVRVFGVHSVATPATLAVPPAPQVAAVEPAPVPATRIATPEPANPANELAETRTRLRNAVITAFDQLIASGQNLSTLVIEGNARGEITDVAKRQVENIFKDDLNLARLNSVGVFFADSGPKWIAAIAFEYANGRRIAELDALPSLRPTLDKLKPHS